MQLALSAWVIGSASRIKGVVEGTVWWKASWKLVGEGLKHWQCDCSNGCCVSRGSYRDFFVKIEFRGSRKLQLEMPICGLS